MNSEEIKEIGQMFLMISKQNNQSPGLTADEKDFIEEFRKNVHALQEAFATNAIPRLKKLEGLHEKVESELKDLRNNTRLKGEGFERLKTRIESSLLDPFEKMKQQVLDFNKKAGELGAKVGGYGGLISSLQRKEGERTEELNKIRKDYRELQDEMWERFKLTEAWIETKDSADKERIRLEILENGHTDKSEQEKQRVPDKIIGQEMKERVMGKPVNKWTNWETSTSLAWGKTPISKLDLSVRAHNALIEGGYHYVGSLLTQSPYDLIQIKNFGRKSLRAVINALEDKSLVLNMQKFNAQKDERNSKENTQRGNLYGIKS